MSQHGRAHRCTLHDMPNCSRSHQAAPMLRVGASAHSIGEWQMASADNRTPPADRVRGWNPALRWTLAILTVIGLSLVVILVSIYTGGALAEGYGPLITITPAPYPDGVTR